MAVCPVGALRLDRLDPENCRISKEDLAVTPEQAEQFLNWAFGAEDTALALSLLDLYATSLGLGVCWGGYLYKTVNPYPLLFEALGLPRDHLAFGAVMIGYPKFKYQRIPVRNQPRVIWK